MRNQSVIGMAGQRQRVWAAADHDYLFFNFSEGAGSAISDKSGSVSAVALTGTAPAWASKARGIDPGVDTHLSLKNGSASAELLDKLARIYATTGNRLNGIMYMMVRMSVAVAPGSDTTNVLVSAGRQGTATEQYGQMQVRVKASRTLEFGMRRRGTAGSLWYANSNAAMTAGGASRPYLLLLSEANETDLTAEWFVDANGSPQNSVTLANGLAEATVRSDDAGLHLMCQSNHLQQPVSYVGAGTVAPVIDWWGIGKMAATPANRAALLKAWQGLCRTGVMPIAFSRITR
ncbi:hypothetical protein GO613_12660 [Azoarcus communis]|uniref:hypothetical protein n=1 Tax=Parazoarcus communis TaxID=41977 RepID=UPI0014593F04|nr:hypothetical protein [Parazoarcus communis]NMG48952.1 hypothetical protein [Parazoarcus communis]